MNKDEIRFAQISVALEECVQHYIASRRERVPSFVNRHFSLPETLQIQKKTFLKDVFYNPVNSLWSIPYLTLKKIFETLDKQGLRQWSHFFTKVPSGLKTGYQKDIEHLVAEELLQWRGGNKIVHNELSRQMHANPILKEALFENTEIMFAANVEFSEVLETYSSSRASIADLAGSVLTLIVGWIYFGDKSLGILGIGQRIAGRMAKDKAASNFFLGKNVGSSFYNLFPPQPTTSQIFLSTLAVGFMLTVFCLIASALFDPLRKKLGLQEKRLIALLDDLETILLAHYKRRLKIFLGKKSEI